MNDQLQKALADIIISASTSIADGVNFLQAQIPDVIYQLLAWQMTLSIIQCVVALLIAILLVYLDVKMYNFYKNSSDKDDMLFFYGMLGLLPRLSWLVPIGLFNLKWLQIWIAPKIFLIEYAATLVK